MGKSLQKRIQETIQMRILAELKGVTRLALFLFESIFNVNLEYSHCPFCNQTLSAYQKKCDRCDCLIGWD